MSDTLGKENQATPTATLEQQILDPNHPKNAREWWARLEITRLRAEVEKLNKSRNKWGQKYNTLLEQHKVTVSQLKAAVWSDSEECKLLTAENEKLQDLLSGVLWMADEWFNHGGDETAFSDDHAASLEAARAILSASQPANACQDTQAAHLREITRLTSRVAELEEALERIDRIEVYDEDARETLRSRLGVMRDIARAAITQEKRDD